MICPLCSNTLNFDSHWGCWACPTMVLLSNKADVATHYSFEPKTKRHVMITMPYRVMTWDDYSLIGKVNDDGKFALIADSRKLRIKPIKPKPEKEMLNRVRTILVFS